MDKIRTCLIQFVDLLVLELGGIEIRKREFDLVVVLGDYDEAR